MSTTIKYRFRVRRRTAASWASLNEVLLDSEFGLESDTGRLKMGAGAWNTLLYCSPGLFDMASLDDGDTLIWDDAAQAWVPGAVGGIASIGGGTGIDVDDTDPDNPIVNLDSAAIASLALAGSAVQPAALAAKADITYVDALIQGLSWKKAVRAATTANGTLASAFANGQSIDGVTLATGDRILLKDQSTASENGIYAVNASGAPTRTADADAGAELVNATVYVSEGTLLADTQWTCSTNAPITVGSTSIAFAQLSAGSSIAWGSITGTLASQTDLQAALNAKAADRSTVTALTISSGVVTIDCALGDFFTLDLTSNVTSVLFINLPAAGKACALAILIKQDATGSRTFALPASFKATGGSDVAVQAAANAYTLLTITTFDQGTRWVYAMQESA